MEHGLTVDVLNHFRWPKTERVVYATPPGKFASLMNVRKSASLETKVYTLQRGV